MFRKWFEGYHFPDSVIVKLEDGDTWRALTFTEIHVRWCGCRKCMYNRPSKVRPLDWFDKVKGGIIKNANLES